MSTKPFLAHSITNRYRYARFRSGQNVEEIANQDKVSVQTITRSIKAVESQAALYGLDSLEVSQAEVVMYNADREKLAISEALVAERKVYATEGNLIGTVVASEPDHEIRLQAVDALTKKVAAVGARHAKGSSLNIQNNQAVQVNSAGSLMTYEDRLREVKKKREQVLTGEVLTITPEVDSHPD